MAFGKTKRQSTFQEEELEFIQIDDFTPGLHSDWFSGSGEGSFPEGAAQINNTYGCVAGPSGGLLPGPRLAASYPENQFDTTGYPTNDEAVHITAFKNVSAANDYPNGNTQTFLPTGDVTVGTGWQTQAGGTTNLFQSINQASPPSISTYDTVVSGGQVTYTFKMGTGSYTSSGRAIQFIMIRWAMDPGFINGGAYSAGINFNGTLYPIASDTGPSATPNVTVSTATVSGVYYVSAIITTNPNTGVAWTDADIVHFADGNANYNFYLRNNHTIGVPNRIAQVQLTVFASTPALSPFTDQSFYSFQWHNQASTTPVGFIQKTKVRTYKFWSNWFSQPPAYTGSYPATTYDLANITSTSPQYVTTFFYGYTSLELSRANKTTPTSPGNPIVASLVNPWNDNTVYSALVYPGTTAPTTDTTETLVITGTNAVRLCAHQDRILAVVNSSIQAFGAKTSIGYEEIRATKTNDYSTDSGQDAIFVNENPSNIGAMVSMNANELIVIKNIGGGYIARGDVATSPTIVRLPGIPSADVNHIPVAIPGAVVYGNQQGVWELRGTNAACISDQLDGRFWIPTGVANPGGQGSAGKYQYLGSVGSFAYLHPYIFVPNGFFYDIRTKSWWRLNATNNYAWAASTSEGYMLCVPSSFTSGQSIADWWDIHNGVASYSWQSHPLPITQTRTMELQKVTLLAQPSNTTVGGTVSLIFESYTSNGQVQMQPVNFTIPASQTVIAQTYKVGIQGYDMTVRIIANSADGTSPAPRIYRVNLGFAEVAPAVA